MAGSADPVVQPPAPLKTQWTRTADPATRVTDCSTEGVLTIPIDTV